MNQTKPSYVFEDGYLDLFPMDYDYLSTIGSIRIDIDEDIYLTLICNKIERIRCASKFYSLGVVMAKGDHVETHTLHVPERAAISINIKGDYVQFRHIKLPKLMRDKVMWALGARRKNKCNSIEEFNEYVDSNAFENGSICRIIADRFYGFFAKDATGKFNRSLSRCYISGYPTREETMAVLQIAYDYNGGPFSNRARVKYVMDAIKTKEEK